MHEICSGRDERDTQIFRLLENIAASDIDIDQSSIVRDLDSERLVSLRVRRIRIRS